MVRITKLEFGNSILDAGTLQGFQSEDWKPADYIKFSLILLTLGIFLGFLHSLLFFRAQSWFFLVFFIAFLFFAHGTCSK